MDSFIFSYNICDYCDNNTKFTLCSINKEIRTQFEQRIHKGHININWDEISENQNLSEEFIEKFKDKVYWERISRKQKLSEEFIEKFKDKVYWDVISVVQKLSEEFIEKFKHKFD
jgi:uncharacterized protein YnzC (UPF0291/DUF896 family)